ncbi:hypothetical protein [Lactococcus garvieae]|uniref:hypothetical protein n=1 Tax=Lactococcus garvieae TaxID=1363 RepID=UPI00254FCD68|nr:hypothetical protein [Lactococcus garvieae]
MTVKYLEYKTQAQIVRETFGITISGMAQAIYNLYGDKCGGDVGHIELAISFIESKGKIPCPKPRKTYELKAIAKWMSEVSGIKYLPEQIMEDIK